MSSTLGASLLRTVLSDGTLKILGSGLDKGPIILIDDVISITGRYPTNEEFVSLLSIPSDLLDNCENINPNECNCADNVENTSCCGNDESC